MMEDLKLNLKGKISSIYAKSYNNEKENSTSDKDKKIKFTNL